MEHFQKKWKLNIGRSSVSEILSCEEKWLNLEDGQKRVKRFRSGRFSELETALFMLFGEMESKQAIISDEILRRKAEHFGELLNVSKDKFKFSRGWLTRFKKRFGISLRRIHGESASADLDVIVSGREELRKKLVKYAPGNIFNMDECGLFYRMEPNATLATRPVSGKNKNKNRLTVALCVNASGTEKLKPLVIGKSKRPRCFGKKFDPNQIVTYRNNKKAWMTSILFAEWLHDLDRKMNKSRRQIVLVLDNASSHIAGELELTNVTLVKLPPNATAHLQPLDQGIIKNFKTHYRTIETHHVLECLETDHSTKIDVKQALYFIEKAWDLVKPETIFNCWRHAGII